MLRLVLLLSAISLLSAGTIDPATIPKFVTNIAIAPPAMKPIIDPTTLKQNYFVIIKQVQQQILPEGYPMTPIYAYGGNTYDPLTGTDSGVIYSYPGPSFIHQRGTPISSTWENRLSGKHMFAIEKQLNFMQEIKDF